MPDKRSTSDDGCLILLIIIWLSLPSGFGDVSRYVFEHPVYFPLFIVFYIVVPIVSFAAWWWVGYKGRPVNPGTRHLLPTDPVYAGYKDHHQVE